VRAFLEVSAASQYHELFTIAVYTGMRRSELLGRRWKDVDTELARLSVTHSFKRIVGMLGLPDVRFHDLRHTHASLMLKQGIHPKIVSERLGHSNIGITLDTYSHVMPGLQEAEALRFEESLQRAWVGASTAQVR